MDIETCASKKPLFAAAVPVVQVQGKKIHYRVLSVTCLIETGIPQDVRPSLSWLSNSSFKRKEPDVVTLDDDGDESDTTKKRRHHKGHKKHKKRRKEHKPSRNVVTEVLIEKSSELSKKVFLEESGLRPEKAIRVDRNPDLNNLAFSSLYRLHAANYSKRDCFVFSSVKTKSELKAPKHKITRYFKKTVYDQCLPCLPDKKEQVFLDVIAVAEDVPLIDLSDDTLDEPEMQFRSLKDDSHKTNLTQPKSNDQYLYDRTIEFNEYLRNNPHDVQKWLEFLSFQDQVFRKDSESASVVEKKVSIIEKAIEKNQSSLELLMKRLDLVKDVWEPDSLDKEWKKLTFVYNNKTSVWRGYIDFVQSHLTFFSVSRVVKIYAKYFKSINTLLERNVSNIQEYSDLEREVIEMSSSYCQFLKNVDLTEKSISCFQSMIEFNMFTPDFLSFNKPLSEWQDFFEAYFDSGVPRIGEDGHVSWKDFMRRNCEAIIVKNTSQELLSQEEDNVLRHESYESVIWVKLEALRSFYHYLAVRSSDPEDLEQTVMFEDVKPCLFRIQTQEGKNQLLIEFFKFLDVDNFVREDYTQLLDKMLNADTTSKFNHFQDHCFIKNVFDELDSYEKTLGYWFWSNRINFALKSSSVEDCVLSFEEFLSKKENRKPFQLWNIFINFMTRIGKRDEARAFVESRIQDIINESSENILGFLVVYIYLSLDIESFLRLDFSFSIQDKTTIGSKLSSVIANLLTGSPSVTSTTLLKLNRKKRDWTEVDAVQSLTCYSFFYFFYSGFKTAVDLMNEGIKEHPHLEEDLAMVLSRINYINLVTSFGSMLPFKLLLRDMVFKFPSNQGMLFLLVNLESKTVGVGQVINFFKKLVEKDKTNTWIFALLFEFMRLKSFKDASGEF